MKNEIDDLFIPRNPEQTIVNLLEYIIKLKTDLLLRDAAILNILEYIKRSDLSSDNIGWDIADRVSEVFSRVFPAEDHSR